MYSWTCLWFALHSSLSYQGRLPILSFNFHLLSHTILSPQSVKMKYALILFTAYTFATPIPGKFLNTSLYL
jgi:hypothetical protein